jgi:two-component sensor histidine kinase
MLVAPRNDSTAWALVTDTITLVRREPASANQVTIKETELENENARLRRLLVQAGIDAAQSDVVNNVQKALIGELHHRVKNLLSMVLSITAQSIRTAKSLEAAGEAITSRIMALSRSYDALIQEGEETAPLGSILAVAIVPFDQGTRIKVSVPSIEVGPSPAMALALVMNELCTNATKYGALSNGAGRIDLTGSLNDEGNILMLTWTEIDGPPVTAPARESFGTQVIKSSVPNADVSLEYLPQGLVCQLRMPVASIN